MTNYAAKMYPHVLKFKNQEVTLENVNVDVINGEFDIPITYRWSRECNAPETHPIITPVSTYPKEIQSIALPEFDEISEILRQLKRADSDACGEFCESIKLGLKRALEDSIHKMQISLPNSPDERPIHVHLSESLWKALGDMSTSQAQSAFINHIYKLCPLFASHVEAHLRTVDSNSSDDASQQPTLNGSPKINHANAQVIDPFNSAASSSSSMTSSSSSSTVFVIHNEAQVRAALNAQTKDQFHAYACQHIPDDPVKQAELIAHLQERHFEEYTAYVKQCMALTHASPDPEGRQVPPQMEDEIPSHSVHSLASSSPPSTSTDVLPTAPQTTTLFNGHGALSTTGADQGSASHYQHQSLGGHAYAGTAHMIPTSHSIDNDSQGQVDSNCPPANSVTTASSPSDNLTSSKQSEEVSTEASESLTSEGRRHDKSDEHRCRSVQPASMWTRGEMQEFKANLKDAKDAMVDIESGETITIRVPAHPSGSNIVWEFATDNYDLGFGLFFEWGSTDDDDKGSNQADSGIVNLSAQPSDHDESKASTVVIGVDEIIPNQRRNCHLEIFCGSHAFPGHGTYLFKFDNSHSYWRAKTLYYRIYYTC